MVLISIKSSFFDLFIVYQSLELAYDHFSPEGEANALIVLESVNPSMKAQFFLRLYIKYTMIRISPMITKKIIFLFLVKHFEIFIYNIIIIFFLNHRKEAHNFFHSYLIADITSFFYPQDRYIGNERDMCIHTSG